MTYPGPNSDLHLDPSGRTLVEGVAKVVEASGATVLLQPEVSSGCKGCVSAGLCGAMSGQSSLAARRFSIANEHGLQVGDKVVVGMAEASLLRASVTAYAIPLLAMLAASIAADLKFGKDWITALAAVGGLGIGMLVARYRAGKLKERGDLTPRFIRHAAPDENCHHE